MNKHIKAVLGIVLSLNISGTALAQWNIKPSGTTNGINAVKLLDANTGFACGDYNTVLKTTNGGNTWQPVATSGIPLVTFLSIDALSNNKIFVARNGLFVTENGGATWTQWGNYAGSAYSIRSIKAINDSTAFITKGGYILKTSNKGASWTAHYSFPDLTGPMVFTGNNDTAFAVSGRTWDNVSYGSIHRSVDGGNTWTDLALNSLQITAIHFRNGRTGYYAAFDNSVYKSHDGGVTWTSIGSPVAGGADYITGLLFPNDTVGYVITQNGAIYKTNNGGTTWIIDRAAHVSNGSYDVPLSALASVNTQQVVVVGSGGTVLKNDGTLSVPDAKKPSVRYYPNPVADRLTIDLGSASEYETVSVFDIGGRKLISEDVSGRQNVQMDMRRFGSGNYVVEVAGKTGEHAFRVTVR